MQQLLTCLSHSQSVEGNESAELTREQQRTIVKNNSATPELVITDINRSYTREPTTPALEIRQSLCKTRTDPTNINWAHAATRVTHTHSHRHRVITSRGGIPGSDVLAGTKRGAEVRAPEARDHVAGRLSSTARAIQYKSQVCPVSSMAVRGGGGVAAAISGDSGQRGARH